MDFNEKELYSLRMLVKTEIAETEELINTVDDYDDVEELKEHLIIIKAISNKLN